jgi:restriction endonuclease Mrr
LASAVFVLLVVLGGVWAVRRRTTGLRRLAPSDGALPPPRSSGVLPASVPTDKFNISPTEFEELVGALLWRMGYSDVRRVGGAGDLNVDLWCRDINQRLIAVQCKRYLSGQSVGSPAIQTFIGMIYRHHGAARGIFVTTSRFTSDAEALAATNNIMLINGERLTELLRRF